MELLEFKKEKEKLEENILFLIKNFQKETEYLYEIKDINIIKNDYMDGLAND